MCPPNLMPPIEEKLLLLYMSATTTSLEDLLVQHDYEGKEKDINYISNNLLGYTLIIILLIAHMTSYFLHKNFNTACIVIKQSS